MLIEQEYSLDWYQSEAKKTAIFPSGDMGLFHLTLKLCGESGEVAEKIGKAIRDHKNLDREEIAKELGDVLWYLANLADWFEYDLSEIAEKNLAKLRSRQERGVLGGSGDNR